MADFDDRAFKEFSENILQRLAIFQTACSSVSRVEAGIKLGIDGSWVSKTILKLEEELKQELNGGTLIDHSGPLAVVPTAAGEKLLELSDPALPLLTTDVGTVEIVRLFPGTALNRPVASHSEAMLFGNFGFNNGITITPNLTSPNQVTGTVFLLQLADAGTTKTSNSGDTQVCAASGFDNTWVGSEVDSPGVELLARFKAISETMTARSYLLWQPNLPHSIAVPLGVLPWSWSGSATRIAYTTIWTLEPGSTGAAQPFISDNSYPPNWSSTVRMPVCQ